MVVSPLSEGLKPKVVFLHIKRSTLTTMYFLLGTKGPKCFISYKYFLRTCFHRNGRIFYCETRLHGTIQILLQIAVQLTIQKLARSLASTVPCKRNVAW